MTAAMRPLLAALSLLALASCGPLSATQDADPCATHCAPGAASLGAPCGDAGDGVCSALGTCLPPCGVREDCASLAPDAGPCEIPACDVLTGACGYQTIDVPECADAGPGQ